VGTVVHLYRDGEAYEVEFVTLDGHTASIVTLEVEQVRPVTRRDLRYAGVADGVICRPEPVPVGFYIASRRRLAARR
jgi:hypothetical protein